MLPFRRRPLESPPPATPEHLLELAKPIPNAQQGAPARHVYDLLKCSHCGGVHLHACPRVRRMRFRGSHLAEVEFWPEGEWSRDGIIWPWQVFGAEELAEHPPRPELPSAASNDTKTEEAE